ncbi:MAG: ATP-binding cassette domain-containing protein [Provencibacterium sp.]|nr:ATP-binding cassette domain-containing protein [Provencibacterium sp.]
MDPVIKVRNLRKVYRLGKEKVVALENVNLEVPPGQICCILGTSGSGKSTFLNQLAGLEKPTKGAVFINGVNISKLNERQLAKFRQKNLGFIFQSYNLLPALTALENVAMPLMFRGLSRRKRNKRAKELLDLVGLKGRLKHKPTQMSGGQQQRVGIARAFVAKPSIVFADEPTGNLDTKTTVEVMQLMVRLAHEHNQTLVLVTHDSELAEFADRIVTLIDGNIVSDRINEHKRTDYVPYEKELQEAGAQSPDEAPPAGGTIEEPAQEPAGDESPPPGGEAGTEEAPKTAEQQERTQERVEQAI